MAVFDYRQAQEVRDAFTRHSVQYLFIGKSGAILLGFPDTTQDADLFVAKSPQNGRHLVNALLEIGFQITPAEAEQIVRGKDSIQLKTGPFDLDLIFAPDGIATFDQAWKNHIDVDGFPVCHIDDIIARKLAANRQKDRESLPRLQAFAKYWKAHRQ